jgi:serine/threonine protein kinase
MLTNCGLLGSGAHGEVYLMTDQNNVRYAVKRIPLSPPSRRVYLFRELEALHLLAGSSNTIPFFGYSLHSSCVYLSFAFYKRSLLDLMKLNEDRTWAKPVLYQLISGVAQCHAKRILHLDLKPANVMVNEKSMETRIIDFGLSRIGDRFVWTEDVITIGYRSSEVLKHKCFDNKADIFSLGVIMTQVYGNIRVLLSSDPSNDAVQYEHLSKTLWKAKNNFSRLFPNVPTGALSLLVKMLAEDSKLRPSAEEILKHEWFRERSHF